MKKEPRIKVLLAKPGLDGHDRGAKVVVLALRDAGIEVIYTGLHCTIDRIVATAVQEGVDILGLSILSGAHLPIIEKLINKLRQQNVEHIPILVGGVIPKEDIPTLKSHGAKAVFPVGSPLDGIIEFINTSVPRTK